MKKFTKSDALSILSDRIEIGPNIWRLRFANSFIANHASPGQFVHVQVSTGESLDPILRRPISISLASPEDGWFEIIYREVGRGTKMLTEMLLGQEVSIMGPLGNGFTKKGERPLLIGGGLGIAPLIFQANQLKQEGKILALGCRNQSEVFWKDCFEGYCNEICISTDDGSYGMEGNALVLLEGMENQIDYIYTCGPGKLIEGVAHWAKKHGIPCEVSLEERMGCGMGVCLGCAIDTKHGRKKVCLNGPVFLGEEIFGYE